MFTFVWRTSFTSGPSLTTTAFKLPMRNWTTRPYSWNKRLIHNYCMTGCYQRWVVHLLQSSKSLKWNFLEPSKEVQTADQRPRSKTQFNIWIWLFKDFFRQGKSRLGLVIVAQLIEVFCNYHLVIKDQRGRQCPTLDQEGTCSSWRLGCWHSCARAALRGGSALSARS